MNAITPFTTVGEAVVEAFRPIAANISAGEPWAGFPNLGMIQLHAEYLGRECIRAEESFFATDPVRFAKHRAEILARFDKLEVEMAEFRARIDPTPPSEPSSMKAAA